MTKSLPLIMLATAAWSIPALAQRQLTAPEAAAAFGAREQIAQISLSPDGTQVAMVVAMEGTQATVMVADIANRGSPVTIARSSGDPERFTGCQWVTEMRLLCNVFVIDNGPDRLSFTRSLALNRDGSAVKVITAGGNERSLQAIQQGGSVIDRLPDGAPGKVLMTRKFVPETSIGTNVAARGNGLGVDLVDVTSGARKSVEPPNVEAVEYISDGHGRVRIRGMRPKSNFGYDGARISYGYRLADGDKWLPLSQFDLGPTGATGFNPYAVDRDLNVAYGFERLNGRDALYRIALDGTLKRELVLARPDVDIDGLVRIGRQGRVVGASFATERRQIEFFDPVLKKLGASLSKALPGHPLISFVDSSTDENKLLMFAGSDIDPGRYYLFDQKTRQMGEVLPVRPQLSGVTLATVKPVSFPAADGTMIPGYLTLPPGSNGKNLPAIVMPHGGPGARDEWGFDWLAQFLANRGYAVLQPNFRGSAGYGDAWFQKNGFKSWRTAIGDINDGGRWLVAQGVAAPSKLGIMGWSYGGYAALQSAVLDPALFKAIVAIAPVTDLETLRGEFKNYTSFEMVDAFIGQGPHVRQGSPAQNAGRIVAPVLMFHGTDDLNVGVGESRLMASRLKAAGKTVELVEFRKLDHQLDDSAARTRMLAQSDAFLRKAMGMAPE